MPVGVEGSGNTSHHHLVVYPSFFYLLPPTPLSFSHKKKDHVVYIYIHPPPGRVIAAFRVPFCSLTPSRFALFERRSELAEYRCRLSLTGYCSLT